MKLLGKGGVSFPKTPSAGILDTFPNRFPHRSYWITFDCPEFTSLCPVTGQPDFAHLVIRYVPDKICIETKSLKYYLASYRGTPAFNEEIANRILDDLTAVCHPRNMQVEGRFASRGGISLTVTAQSDPQ